MDPFVVSLGKNGFRIRLIRHPLNTLWDEKLFFHARAYESAFNVQLAMLDWDKFPSNNHFGNAGSVVANLMADAPQRDEGMKKFSVPLLSSCEKGAVPWVITFR
jgi:phosphatidylserine decarboxylase